MRPTRALWHLADDTTTVESGKTSISDEMCIVETAYSLISLGTELLVARGGVPEEMQSVMQVPYMGGDLRLPVKYG